MLEGDSKVGGRERQSLVRPVGLFALTSAAALAVTAVDPWTPVPRGGCDR